MEVLDYPIDLKDIERAVAKYPPVGGLKKHYSKFHKDDIVLIERELSFLFRYFGY